MFDKLVESNLTGADLKPRRKIFAASFFVVGLLFLTAVVVGIYAADYSLGTDSFEIAELLSPIAQTEPTEEPEQPRQQPRTESANNNEIVRQVLMAPTTDPSRVPDRPSVERNPYASFDPNSDKPVRIDNYDSNPTDQGGPNTTIGSSSSNAVKTDEPDNTADVKPPPVTPKIEKPKALISKGPLTGQAKFLPQPIYTPSAKAVGASGAVTVQITVDEYGKVISAKAVSGHIMLRAESEKAAWKARFDPTTLSGVPVKVTGIITYNFIR